MPRQRPPGHDLVPQCDAEFVTLDCAQLARRLDQRWMNLRAMRASAPQPVLHRFFGQPAGLHKGPPRTASGAQGQHGHDEVGRFAQAREGRAFACPQGLATDAARVAALLTIRHLNVARPRAPRSGTSRIRAKCCRGSSGASPSKNLFVTIADSGSTAVLLDCQSTGSTTLNFGTTDERITREIHGYPKDIPISEAIRILTYESKCDPLEHRSSNQAA